ncbi:MAG: beta-L-arabinofuranosidase domain-containing protein [Bacteroidia bacterium]
MELLFTIKEVAKDSLQRIKHKYLPFPMKIGQDELHLQKTMEWLWLSCENGQGGSASHYNLVNGKWLDPFPETTGYIIPTFFDYAEMYGEKRFYDRAIRLTDWLGEAQLDNGACMQGSWNRSKGKNKPIIFNTGQNIFGWLRTYQETREQKYLDMALKAGDFLCRSTGEDLIWNQHLHNNIPHTYNSRVSWSLLLLAEETGLQKYRDVALANLDWVVEQQLTNGWFQNCNFKPGEYPNTHGIAYTTRGLLESYLVSKDEKYLDAAQRTAHKLFRIFELRKYIRTFWDEKWRNHGKFLKSSKGPYICLTGNIQISIVWMKLYEITGDATYMNSAMKMLDFIKSLQYVDHPKKELNGGIKGSFPFYGRYSIIKMPNWAAKFFVDAMMLKIRLQDEIAKNN